MKKAFLLIIFSLMLSTSVLAQKPTDYNLLAPIPIDKCRGDESGTESCTTSAKPYIEGLFTLIIAIAGALAVLQIIFGGIKYMSTDAVFGKNEAKGTIENAIWGLLLAMSAWLILNTVNPNLVEFNLKIPVQEIPTPTATTPTDINLPSAGDGLSQQEASSQFEAASIPVTTSVLQGIRQETINEVINLKNACYCDVIVTSATGGTHNPGEHSHANGWKVDLRPNNNLDSYIFGNYDEQAPRSNGDRVFRAPNGNIYTLETHPPNPRPAQWGPHWDIQVR